MGSVAPRDRSIRGGDVEDQLHEVVYINQGYRNTFLFHREVFVLAESIIMMLCLFDRYGSCRAILGTGRYSQQGEPVCQVKSHNGCEPTSACLFQPHRSRPQ